MRKAMWRPDFRVFAGACAALSMLCGHGWVQADEAVIRKALAERMPKAPKPDEVRLSPVPGLWEVRIGNDILYTDAKGEFLVQGDIIDLRTRQNLTQARIDKLTAVRWADLPLKDAMVLRQGKGTRKIAVFGDPYCGFCRRFEATLVDAKDVTIYSFIVPILGERSEAKARELWCQKDPMKAWRDWMLHEKEPARVMGRCDTGAIERNLAFANKHRITGTPTIVFEDGTRLPGAIPAAQLEQRLTQAVRGKS
jgi:thiol:disulfide interchange protein DsbC